MSSPMFSGTPIYVRVHKRCLLSRSNTYTTGRKRAEVCSRLWYATRIRESQLTESVFPARQLPLQENQTREEGQEHAREQAREQAPRGRGTGMAVPRSARCEGSGIPEGYRGAQIRGSSSTLERSATRLCEAARPFSEQGGCATKTTLPAASVQRSCRSRLTRRRSSLRWNRRRKRRRRSAPSTHAPSTG